MSLNNESNQVGKDTIIENKLKFKDLLPSKKLLEDLFYSFKLCFLPNLFISMVSFVDFVFNFFLIFSNRKVSLSKIFSLNEISFSYVLCLFLFIALETGLSWLRRKDTDYQEQERRKKIEAGFFFFFLF